MNDKLLTFPSFEVHEMGEVGSKPQSKADLCKVKDAQVLIGWGFLSFGAAVIVRRLTISTSQGREPPIFHFLVNEPLSGVVWREMVGCNRESKAACAVRDGKAFCPRFSIFPSC